MKRLIVFSALLVSFAAVAQERPVHGPPNEANGAVFAQCAQQAGLPKREEGAQRTPPTAAQKSAMDNCLQQHGITPPTGPKYHGEHNNPPPRKDTDQP